MPELTFSTAKDEDVSVIYDMCKNLIDAYEDVDRIDYQKVLQWVYHKINSNISSYTCVYKNRDKVAYYRLDQQDEKWELDDLYVLSDFRCCGIGSQILKKCILESSANLYLYVFKRNTRAIRLYEKHGFRVTQYVGGTRCIMEFKG